MRKILILTVLAGIVLSCGTPKTVIQSKRVMKGNWSLDNISYSETGKFNVELFNDTSHECFEGSNWQFIPNNNTGTYTLNGGDCESGQRYFIFTIQEMDKDTGLYDFLLKPTDAKKKSKSNIGFRMSLTQLSESSMTWQQTVDLDGSPFVISMNFSKITQ